MSASESHPAVKVAVSSVAYWVDRPYTYLVPERLRDRVCPGMRVAVPFGGNRPREGIVLAWDDADHGGLKLKSVLDTPDENPIFTEDQIKLAVWMHERFFCTVMDALRAMVPSGLWYDICERYAVAADMDTDAAYAAAGRSGAEKKVLDVITGHGGVCDLTDIEAVFTDGNPGAAINSLVKKGVLVSQTETIRRSGKKTVRKATLAVPPQEAMAKLSVMKRAPRQSAVLRLLAEIHTAAVSDLCYFTGSGREAIKALADKGLITLTDEVVYRRPDYDPAAEAAQPVLNDMQQQAFDRLNALLTSGKPHASLLYGVTGSGKTTVYIRLIAETLRQGRSAIMLVPEISLTPQMLRTFSSHFGDSIAVLHSSLSMGERCDEWLRIRNGQAKVIIGTRSAVFAPVTNPGIIIIDEEQEDTYKSESTPRYHTRDVAQYICAQHNALLLMGSATPDVCSMYAAKNSRFSLQILPGRYNKQALPRVEIADMRAELKSGNVGCISSLLRQEIQDNLSRGEQSILFLNRRGTNSMVLCSECGYTFKCPNCTASLTYHSVGAKLVCHYCGHIERVPSDCPDCGGKLNFVGLGTQRIVEELNTLFPDVPVLRMDADSVSAAGSHKVLLEKFRSQNIPLMVGTQMVAKGLNFENVTLVGIVSADQMLYSSDYRAGERTFSLITQVIGRSGRFSKSGRAVIQTFTPDNQVIEQASRQDYDGFYLSEIQLRQFSALPPFSDIFVLTAAGKDETQVLECCRSMRARLGRLTEQVPDVGILGPAPLPIAKVNNIWRYKITVRTSDSKHVRPAVSQVLTECNNNKTFRGVSVYADFNPLD